jgi:TolB-like protein
MRFVMLLTAIAMTAGFSRAQTQPARPIVLEQGKVAVLPFQQIGGDASQHFIADALQQGLISEIGRVNLRAVPLASTKPADNALVADPVQTAREAGAQYAIAGSYQINQSELRITGQIWDAKTGELLGSVKATGSQRDLFALEDSVGDQARRILRPGPVTTDTAANIAATPQPAPTIQPTGPVQAIAPTRPYIGSDLQNAVATGGVSVPDYNRYIYNPPAYYYPYYGYSTYYGGYSSYYPRYSCSPYSYNSCYGPTHYFSARIVSPGTSAFNFSHGYGNVAGPITPMGNVAGPITPIR